MIFKKLKLFARKFLGKKLRSKEEIIRDLIPVKNSCELRLPLERLISNFDISKKSIVIIDDSKGIVDVIGDILKDVSKLNNFDLNDYNFLTFYDRYAPFVLIDTIDEIQPMKIDFAIIDIVLPGKMKIKEQYIRLDGIDVAIFLNKYYGCQNFVFFTGNILSDYPDFIEEKMNRFKDYFKCDMNDHIIFKNDHTENELLDLFRDLLNESKFNHSICPL